MAEDRLQAAEKAFRAALQLDPLNPQAMQLLGWLTFNRGRHEEGLALMERSVANAPRVGAFYCNLGEALRRLGRIDQAHRNLSRAISLSPNSPESWQNMGLVLVEMRDYKTAITSYEKAIYLRGDYANAHWSLAQALLAVGGFDRGFAEYEWRWKTTPFLPHFRRFNRPPWAGETTPGKTLLVWSEQEPADTILIAGFVKLLSQQGLNITFEVHSELKPLMQSAGLGAKIISPGEDPGTFDFQTPQMSLLGLMNLQMNSIPASNFYLSAPDATPCQSRINTPPGVLKIGLCWAADPGGGGTSNDRNRSCPPEVLATLDEVASVQFFSLQKDPPNTLEIIDLSPDLTDLSSLAGAIANLDLVIAVDSTIAHLAAAMGKPVWLMLPYVADWRWFTDRADSPWYPTMRLFRQPSRGDWQAVAASLATELIKQVKKSS